MPFPNSTANSEGGGSGDSALLEVPAAQGGVRECRAAAATTRNLHGLLQLVVGLFQGNGSNTIE